MKKRRTIPAICVLAASVCAGAKEPPFEAVREIMDASTGVRWVLVKDAAHPGGPGRLVADRSQRAQTQIVIRAGDAVVVEGHNERVDLRLQAIALSPSAAGDTFAARLCIGGKVVQARALAPGRAELTGEESLR